jgi:hypothetical protein
VTITLVPTAIGPNVLHVKTIDKAGNHAQNTDNEFDIMALPPQFTTPPTPHDVNSDGQPDVVRVLSDGRACLYTGSGTVSGSAWQAGGGCSAVIERDWAGQKPVSVGDWDGDGKNDVVVMRDSTLCLLPGKGAGEFGECEPIGLDQYDAELNPVRATVSYRDIFGPGDWDGDGHADLIARSTSGDLHLLLNSGYGTLVTNEGALDRKIGSGWTNYALVTAGDVNRDGWQDLVGKDSSGNLWFYPGTSLTTFGPRIASGSGWNIYSQIFPVGDWNQNGTQDVAAVEPNGDYWYYDSFGRSEYPHWNSRLKIGSGWTSNYIF